MGRGLFAAVLLLALSHLAFGDDVTTMDALSGLLGLGSVWPTPCASNCATWKGVTGVGSGAAFSVSKIDLSSMQLNVAFPAAQFNLLTNLTDINLNFNNFTGCGFSDLSLFPSLVYLRLRSWKQNAADTCPIPPFWLSSTLQTFNIDSGKFVGTLSNSTWVCTKMESLNLRYNGLSGPVPWPQLTQITSYLRILLTGNQFDKHVFSAMSPVSNSRGLYELRTDTLQSNFPGAGVLDPLDFNLTIVDFSSPNGTGALTGSWSNATYFGPKLVTIDVSGNPSLGYASGVSRFPNYCVVNYTLTYLNVSYTNASGDNVPSCYSNNFPFLTTFDATSMNLTFGYPNFRRAVALTTLRLGGNSFNGTIPTQWGGLPLQIIDLSNMLVPVPLPLPASLATLTSTLRQLNLRNSGLVGQLQNFLLNISLVDLRDNPGLQDCSVPGGTHVCGETSNILLNTNQCITVCPPITGCPFPPPTVPAGSPPPVCNGTAWLVSSINSTGTIVIDQDAPLVIIADFTQEATGTLEIYVDSDGRPVITVDGNANLDGSLIVYLSQKITTETLIPILSAEAVNGNFTNVDVRGECILSATPIATSTGYYVLVVPDTSGDCATDKGGSGLSKIQLAGVITVRICLLFYCSRDKGSCIAGLALIVVVVLVVLKATGVASTMFSWKQDEEDILHI